jgi:hypothetical protein
MHTSKILVPAIAGLLAVTLLTGCGLVSSLPGFGGGSGPGAAKPGAPNVGVGIDLPAPPAGGIVQPPDNPTLVVVHPGQANPLEVTPAELRAMDRDGHTIVRVRWWGGVEPCEILDSVDVQRTADTFTIAARVGSAPGGQVACIDIARDTATLVDLGVLAPGQYTIRASKGDAPPIVVTIPEPGAAPS